MSRILITGGAGFIGHATATALLSTGRSVVILDSFSDLLYSSNLKQQRIEALTRQFPSVEVIPGDVRDAKSVARVFKQHTIDEVLHFAAHANVAHSFDHAQLYRKVNVQGTTNILQAAGDHRVRHVVFASSSTVYEESNPPFSEKSPLKPLSPYGESKLAAEEVCKAWQLRTSIPLTNLRFFSVYGAWGRPDMAPQLFASALLESRALTMVRSRARDYVHISDVVSAILASLHRPHGIRTFNIGSGQPTSLESMADALATALNRAYQANYVDPEPGDMTQTWANISRARDQLGYVPGVSITEGAAKLVEWIQRQNYSQERV